MGLDLCSSCYLLSGEMKSETKQAKRRLSGSENNARRQEEEEWPKLGMEQDHLLWDLQLLSHCDNHGFDAAAAAGSWLPPLLPASIHSLQSQLPSCQFSSNLASFSCLAGNEALPFSLSYFSAASVPHLMQPWHRENNRRWTRQDHNKKHV